MKPTLDEEISEIAEIAVPQNVHGPVGREKAYERKDIVGWAKSAIYAGIEAWKRREPTQAMKRAFQDDKQLTFRDGYRAMMSASLRTSETTGEG